MHTNEIITHIFLVNFCNEWILLNVWFSVQYRCNSDLPFLPTTVTHPCWLYFNLFNSFGFFALLHILVRIFFFFLKLTMNWCYFVFSLCVNLFATVVVYVHLLFTAPNHVVSRDCVVSTVESKSNVPICAVATNVLKRPVFSFNIHMKLKLTRILSYDKKNPLK